MDLITAEQADACIGNHFPLLADAEVSLSDAVGRVLRQPALAERDQPPFDRVTMDGIAIDSVAYARGVRDFTLAGVQAAGRPAIGRPEGDTCVEVMTGAVLPAGCDCVIPVEHLRSGAGKASLLETARVDRGKYVHRAGSDHKAGAKLLSPGCRLNATDIAILASCGYQMVRVAARPRICVIATGDELVTGATVPDAHQIRSSNAPAIAAAIRLHGWGNAQVMHLQDDRDGLQAGIAAALGENDLLILSGGVSRGRFDYVPEVLASLDVQTHFHRVSQRPGKPMWFGSRRADDRVVFGLPGNPVSSLVCLHRFVLPALLRAGGGKRASFQVRLGEALNFPPPLTWFVPATLASSEGSTVATPRLTNTSGDFAALAGTEGFIELPGPQSTFAKGISAEFFSWGRC